MNEEQINKQLRIIDELQTDLLLKSAIGLCKSEDYANLSDAIYSAVAAYKVMTQKSNIVELEISE